jgi:HAD superfamily hydrolase (TIGR01549 family)
MRYNGRVTDSSPSAVLFDLDDTLVDRWGAYVRWAKEFSCSTGVPLGWLLDNDKAYASRRIEFFQDIRYQFGVRDNVDRLYSQYRYRLPQLVQPDCRVNTAVLKLACAGIPVAVVTNGEVQSQNAKLAVACMDRLFDTVAVSAAVGVAKPDPAIFRVVLHALGVDRDRRVWMVGDNTDTDVAGAVGSGLSSVLIGWSGQRGAALADVVCADVPDAVEHILSLSI